MKKIFSFFTAMLVAVAVNATILDIAPNSPQSSDNIRREIRDHINAGDTLRLADGTYTEADVVELNKDVVIMAAEGAKPIVKQQYYMKLLNSAKVTIIGVKFDGSLYPASDHCIRAYDQTEGKTLTVIDCEFTNYPNGFIFYPQRADRSMQTLTIKNCHFKNFGRSAVYIESGSSSPLPLAELNIENSTFMATTPGANRVVDLKNGGSEVADAKLRIDHCTFYNCNAVRSEKSTDVVVSNSIFAAPEGATYAATTFYAGAAINNCLTFNVSHSNGPTVTAPVVADPQFADAANLDLHLAATSPALTAGTDGKAIGDPRWVPAEEPAAEPQMKTIYCKMDKDWWKEGNAAIGCYTWNDGGVAKAAWPGERMTPVEGETDLWSIELDINTYHMCIFTRMNPVDGDNQDWGAKTGDLTIPTDENDMYTITSETAVWGDPGVAGAWSKYSEAPAEPEIPYMAIIGDMNSWDGAANPLVLANDSLTASVTIHLAMNDDSGYGFKVLIGDKAYCIEPTGSWYAFHRDWTTASGINHVATENEAFWLQIDMEGDYVFTWTLADKKLEITFPEAASLEAPNAAPTAPTLPEAQVKAVYSAKYSADCNFGEWGSGTQYAQEDFGKKFVTAASGYFGLEFKSHMDCSEMEALHLDVWIAEDAEIRIVPIHGGTEVGMYASIYGQQWNSIDIQLEYFEGVTNWSDVYQIKIDNAANLTFWLNNVYFYTTVAPTVDLEDGYYIIGLKSWSIYDLTAEDLFAANPDNAAEYVITKTLTEGKEFKVVSVANNTFGTWYPAEGGNYAVDFAHAGEDKAIYFRPDYSGGDDWHAHCIFVAADESNNPWETWFAVGDTWNTETESYLEWDEDNEKATIHINVDKNGQWRAQAKYHGPVAEAGKYYRVALKLKANHNIQNVTIKYQDNVEMMYVADAALEADVEYVFDKKAAGKANGNGIMVLDFGFAKSGDIIEIYDVVIEETAAPDLEDGYYIIGLHGWDIFDLTADDKFALNPDNEAEYVLADVTLAANDEFKVVAVANSALGTWYPAEAGNYHVGNKQAGERDIYFRPDYQGGEGWHAGCIYVYVEDEPVADCDWDELDWVVDATAEQTFGSQFKVCAGDPAPDVVNVQASFGTETGIYMRFNAADFSVVSLPADKYATQGAGILLYVSAFVDKETDVTIVTGGDTYEFTVYNAKGMNPTTAISNTTVAEKAVKVIENGQLYIILNGVRYNAQGQME